MKFTYDKENATKVGNMGVAWAFALLFTGLKLTDNIDWSWWWVFAPVWGAVCVGVVLLLILLLVYCIKG